ncbi:hypothetical protein A6J79_09535 [Streptococcus equinus]|nr:hypothetical protein A6J79_09535 [Streptococcus equinus]
MDKNARRRLNRANADKRLRFSVRKLSVGVASVAVAAFMVFGGNVVSADTLAKTDSSSTSTEKPTSVPNSGEDSGTNDSDSTIGKDSTVATVAENNAISSVASTASSTSAGELSSKVEDKTVKSEATSESDAVLKEATSQASKASVVASQSAAPVAQSEAPVASSAASAVAESTAVSSETAAESTVAEEPKESAKKVASKTPNVVAKSDAISALAAAQNEIIKGYAGFRRAGVGVSGFRSTGVSSSGSYDPKTGETTVTKENFLDYFRLNGSATYDKDNGIVTLTPDETSKGGNFSLNSKINMNQSFKLTGAVNLGDKTQAKGGADGIGFAFHTGEPTDIGASGGNLGIGGLRNATGFKLDTYHNVFAPPKGNRFNTSGKGFFEYGWAEDPKLDQYGAWVNTTLKNITGNYQGKSVEYERWWADTDFDSAQSLDASDLDNQFHKFTIDYNGTTRELTISYQSNSGTKEWKKTVSTPEEVMSMVVTASTGGNKNLQQFKIESFNFYQGASVDVRYEDEQGHIIAEGSVTYPQGAFKGKTYTTEQKDIPNYEFVGLKPGSLPTSGTLADWGSNGIVTYVYRQGKEPVTDPAKLNKKVTRTIKYEYADGQTDGRPALKAPVTQEATFTRTGERNRVTGEETFTPWTPATKELAEEGTPVVTGFVADKANVAAKTVTPDDKDSEEVVQYKKLGSYVPNVPDGFPKVPNLPYPNDPTDPTKPGTDLPLIPHVPGTTPVGPDGTTPLTPKDPNDPSKGYNPPSIPSDPTQDTPINYVKDDQKAIITFVDQDDNNKELGKVVENGKSGDPIETTNYAARLKELTDKGYEVVNDEFAGPKNFDNDDKTDQQFVVTLRQGKEPVTDPAKLNSKVTRTIKYEYADGQTDGRPALKAPVTQEATFTRTGERNRVTGEETFTPWTPATKELAEEGTPVVTGFVADKANVAAKTVTPDDKDSEEVVQYKKLGSYVPNVPDGLPKVPNLPYPNDPTDPTKPGTDLPLIPHVPGTTPVGPDGTTPLTPKDPNDPSKGYNPPSIPSDPTQDTPINYVKDGQKAIITFVDQDDNNKELGKVVESGKSGEPIGTTNYAARLKELTDKGYEVVNDEFAGPKNFDNDNKTDQQFVVTLRQGKEPVTDPAKLNSKVTRTIKYEYADGQTDGRPALKAPVTQEATFTRTGERNRVTGEETFTPWTPATKELAEEGTPVVTGFVADKANVAAKTVTPDDKDSEEVVQYKKLGSYVPNVPDGFPKVPNLPYPNDPTDPTKPGTDLPLIPHVPGTTPVGPDGTTPLTPKDPNDPSKGYNPPSIPSDPTQDTPINYVKDDQKAIITFVDQDDNNKELGKVVENGKSGDPIETTNYAARLKELTDKGYEVVNDEFAGPKNFDNDDKTDQQFVVTLRQGKEPVTDPAKLNSKVTRTIKYEYADGQTDGRPALKAPVTQEATFTRTGERNRVTGEETFGAWTPATKELAEEATPVVTGFVADKANVAAKTVTPDDKDSEEVVQYKKLGSYVPNVPDGLPKVPNLPYPNDPTDPTKPGTDLPLIPHVPGTTPVGPDGTTPLTPKDPNDPSKGYNPPSIPSDPTQDTPINYVTDKQKAITNFVTENGKVVATPVVDEGDSGANFTKSKVDEVTKTIEKLEKAGYRIVKNDFPSKDTDRVFDKDKSVDQIFNVTVAERIIPVTPGKPVDPNNPNLPKNPDGTPVTPSTPEPGKPVFPNDPNSPVWPNTVKDMVIEKAATRTIKYVDRNGKEISETRVETIKFTRDAEVNLVTGEITYGEWTTDRNDDIFNGYPVPVVKGYIAKAGDLESSTKDVKVTPDTIKDINETVVYDKLGSWVPNIPGTPTNPIPYPNDPKDPTKPGTEKPKVPYVPGFIPVDPEGQPLKPVDPNDPTKGYEVPNVPEDPTKDTPINYVPNDPKPNPAPADNGDNNGNNNGTPTTPAQPVAPSTPQYMDGQRELPNTGTEDHASLGALGLLGALSGFALIARKKREDEE